MDQALHLPELNVTHHTGCKIPLTPFQTATLSPARLRAAEDDPTPDPSTVPPHTPCTDPVSDSAELLYAGTLNVRQAYTVCKGG